MKATLINLALLATLAIGAFAQPVRTTNEVEVADHQEEAPEYEAYEATDDAVDGAEGEDLEKRTMMGMGMMKMPMMGMPMMGMGMPMMVCTLALSRKTNI
ncbi:uncharacterized protein VTP21DRAFT_8258 [Calcarisporiella thermophila]|uniref:uncharacterized protein n=1 Tax=Calcarisporiella thermophila TaxID=911321 RepID=UPI0037421FDC